MRLRNLFENTTQTIAIIFGRFNPPHKGHKAAWELMSKYDNWYVGTNRSTIGPKDPLPFDVKVEAMTTIWPEVADHIVAETSWLTMASKVWNEYGDVRLLCFTDEAWVVKTLEQYNGKEGAHGLYKFSEIAQEPTPRLSSATALRAAVEAGDRDAFTDAAGVDADTPVNGTPFFDLVSEYLLPYAEKAKAKAAKKKAKELAEGFYTSETIRTDEGLTSFLIKWFEKRGAKFTGEQRASMELHHAKYNQNEMQIQKLTAESNAGENIDFKKLDRLQKEQEILKQEMTRIGKDAIEQGGGYKPLKEATNPWTGKDEAKAAAWEKLSPEDQKWLGGADPTDEYILMRAPNKGKPAPAAATGSEDNMDDYANTGVTGQQQAAQQQQAAATKQTKVAATQGSEDNMDDTANTGVQQTSAKQPVAQQAPAQQPADDEEGDDEEGDDASYMANTDAQQATNQAQVAQGAKASPTPQAAPAAKTAAVAPSAPAAPAAKLSTGQMRQHPQHKEILANLEKTNPGDPSNLRAADNQFRKQEQKGAISKGVGQAAQQPQNAQQAQATAGKPVQPDPNAQKADGQGAGAGNVDAQPNAQGTVNSAGTQGSDAATPQPNADGTVNSTGNAEPKDTVTTQTGANMQATTTKTNVQDYTPDQKKADELAATNAEIDQEIADAQAAGDTAKVAELEKEKASINAQPAGTGTAANKDAGQPSGVAGAQDANVPNQAGQAQDANIPDQTTGAEKVTAQDVSPEEQDKAAARIQELLKKANLQENSYYNKLAILLNEHSVLKEALTPEEMKELQDLLGKVQGNEKYKDLVAQAQQVVKQPAGTGTAANKDAGQTKGVAGAQDDDVGDYVNPNRKYTLNGQDATKQEVEKVFGKDAKDDYQDIQQIKQDIQGLTAKAKEEKNAWMQKALSGDKYPNGVSDDPEDPEYPKELKAIDDKYAAQAEKLQKQSEKLAKDPAVQKLIAQGGKDDFDRWFDGDLDSDEYMQLKTGGQSVKGSSSQTKPTAKTTSTSTRTVSGGTTTTGGGSTTYKAAKKGPGPDTEKLKKQKQDMEIKMKEYRANFRKENPDAKKLAAVRTPEYKKLKDEYKKISAAYRASFVEVEPSSITKEPSTTTFEPAQESVELNRIKLLAGMMK